MREQEWQEQLRSGELEPHVPDGIPVAPLDLHADEHPQVGSAVLVARFAEEGAARACFRSLEARGFPVMLARESASALGPDFSPETAPDRPQNGFESAAEHPRHGSDTAAPAEFGMGRGAVLGASLGATAGFLAASFLAPPPGAATATGAMLTTLAGAGLGSFLGNLADEGRAEQQGERDNVPGQGRTWYRVEARVEASQVDEVITLISSWGPREVRLQ